ncbi:hypothetical protein NDU88_006431 [Pleurodeles waltl]|uniref:Uncharacterized protein n=1 Tax=Pleurodeles waltl TaxID=8319 RepID=A0AAV7NQ72_PLEWA|nr:hypothetical protein NDU88_006431 [Pleurodeles waltl]
MLWKKIWMKESSKRKPGIDTIPAIPNAAELSQPVGLDMGMQSVITGRPGTRDFNEAWGPRLRPRPFPPHQALMRPVQATLPERPRPGDWFLRLVMRRRVLMRPLPPGFIHRQPQVLPGSPPVSPISQQISVVSSLRAPQSILSHGGVLGIYASGPLFHGARAQPGGTEAPRGPLTSLLGPDQGPPGPAPPARSARARSLLQPGRHAGHNSTLPSPAGAGQARLACRRRQAVLAPNRGGPRARVAAPPRRSVPRCHHTVAGQTRHLSPRLQFTAGPRQCHPVAHFQKRSQGPEIRVAAWPQPPSSPVCGTHSDGPGVGLVYADNRRPHGSR